MNLLQALGLLAAVAVSAIRTDHIEAHWPAAPQLTNYPPPQSHLQFPPPPHQSLSSSYQQQQPNQQPQRPPSPPPPPQAPQSYVAPQLPHHQQHHHHHQQQQGYSQNPSLLQSYSFPTPQPIQLHLPNHHQQSYSPNSPPPPPPPTYQQQQSSYALPSSPPPPPPQSTNYQNSYAKKPVGLVKISFASGSSKYQANSAPAYSSAPSALPSYGPASTSSLASSSYKPYESKQPILPTYATVSTSASSSSNNNYESSYNLNNNNNGYGTSTASVAASSYSGASGSDYNAAILRHNQNIKIGSHHGFDYTTSNGISHSEMTSIKVLPGFSATAAVAGGWFPSGGNDDRGDNSGRVSIVKEGQYSYISPEGQPISVSYIADENGFRAAGAHLPVPPVDYNHLNYNQQQPLQQYQQPQQQQNYGSSSNSNNGYSGGGAVIGGGAIIGGSAASLSASSSSSYAK